MPFGKLTGPCGDPVRDHWFPVFLYEQKTSIVPAVAVFDLQLHVPSAALPKQLHGFGGELDKADGSGFLWYPRRSLASQSKTGWCQSPMIAAFRAANLFQIHKQDYPAIPNIFHYFKNMPKYQEYVSRTNQPYFHGICAVHSRNYHLTKMKNLLWCSEMTTGGFCFQKSAIDSRLSRF